MKRAETVGMINYPVKTVIGGEAYLTMLTNSHNNGVRLYKLLDTPNKTLTKILEESEAHLIAYKEKVRIGILTISN